jgi:H+/gluconate symporter-like permease
MSIETLETFLQNLDLALLLKDPSAFFLDYGIEISNLQVAVIVGIISLFFIELIIKSYKKNSKQKNKDIIDFEETSYESNEISSNPVTQKIDLAIALMNMGSTSKAKKILTKLKLNKLTNKESKQIDKLIKEID